MFSPELILVIILILGAEFVNGWTDAPNSIATVISTRVISPIRAVFFAGILNIVGVLSGTAVAVTIGKGIIKPEAINLEILGAAMLSIIFWSTLTWYFGLPTSESHALISGLTGASLAWAGPSSLLWVGWQKVLIGLGLSTFIGLLGGFLIMFLIYRFFANSSRPKTETSFGKLQILSAGFMAFSHGSNDGQKFMGVFALALLLAGVIPSFQIPLWVILICALTMGIGTALGGWRIMKTLGMRLTKLRPSQGFSAETAAALTIQTASHFGIPLSTTHTISTAIMGVGSARRISAVKWGVGRNIVFAWILTFPVCGIFAFLLTKIILFLF